MRYKVVIEEESGGGYSVYVPSLPGCASQGETIKEALSNIKKAIKLYLWSLKEDQRKLTGRQVFIKELPVSV